MGLVGVDPGLSGRLTLESELGRPHLATLQDELMLQTQDELGEQTHERGDISQSDM